jgi:hypothetical protein
MAALAAARSTDRMAALAAADSRSGQATTGAEARLAVLTPVVLATGHGHL